MMAMVKILEGSALGQFIADQQSLLGLVGLRSQRAYMTNVRSEVMKQRDASLDKEKVT